MLPVETDPRDEAERYIRNCESKKIRMYSTPGNFNSQIVLPNLEGVSAIQHSTVVDENYMVIGAHLEPALMDRIKRGDYVDFAKLLHRDKTLYDEPRLELINKGGHTFFVPAEREVQGVTSFHKWEQAFRVYSNIYVREHPSRASELVQYNHVIFTATNMYIWENVYTYDREFRVHMSYFPDRSWAIILQQAWAMNLKDKINLGNNGFKGLPNNSNNLGNQNKFKREICKKYNKGLCNRGRSCHFEHRCLECGKFGHGEHICRQKVKNGGGGSTSNSNITTKPVQAKQ